MSDDLARALPKILIVMGVSGSGKSTIARALAERLDWRFAEGDDFHSKANIAKMQSGRPLTDDDRLPWLNSISMWIDARRRAGEPTIVTCSALKHSYRTLLANGQPDVLFVYLKGEMPFVSQHLQARIGHFMPAALLPSQFETLEEPTVDENFIAIDPGRPVPAILSEIEAYLSAEPQPKRPVT